MSLDAALREQLVDLLEKGHAHLSFAEAVANFPEEHINTFPPHVNYTFWHLLEHLRICQIDILNYLLDAEYQEPEWPRDYWPAIEARASMADWQASVAAFERDRAALIAMVADPDIDLLMPVPSHPAHTLLRQAFSVADHNAYHIGELAILRQTLDAWGERV